jgi:hypothetical protein
MAKWKASDFEDNNTSKRGITSIATTSKGKWTAKDFEDFDREDKKQAAQEKNTIKALQKQKESALKEKNTPSPVQLPKNLDINKVMDYAKMEPIKPKSEFEKRFEDASKQNFVPTNVNSKLPVKPKTPDYMVGKIPAPVSTVAGVADTATMGLIDATARRNANPNDPMRNFLDAAKTENPAAYTGGQIGGYLIPGAAIERGTGALLKGVTKGTPKLVSKLATGATTGGLQELTEGTIRELGDGNITAQDFKDIGKRTAQGIVLGGATDVALSGLGAGFNKLRSTLREPAEQAAQSTGKVVVEPIKNIKPISQQGKFTIKNSAYDSAVNDYNEAITKIQNHFGTNELRVNEVPLIKSELGIDLDSIINRMEQAEKPIKLNNSSSMQLKRSAGAASDKSYELSSTLNKQPSLRPLNASQTVKSVDNINTRPLLNNQLTMANKSMAEDIGLKTNSKPEKLNIDLNENALKEGGDINSARNKIDFTPKTKKQSLSDLSLKVRTQLVDRYAALERLEKKVTGKVASAENSLYKHARLFEGVSERANKIVENELKPIIQKAEKAGHNYKDLGLYAEAVHARDVNKAGINSGFTNDEINDVIQKLGTPEMETARKELVAYNNRRLDDLVNSGRISQESADVMKQKWPNYMSLARAFDDNKVEFGTALGKSFGNVTNPIKELKGSNRKVIDPIESIIKNTFQIENSAGRNKVGLQLSKLADQDIESTFVRKLNPDEAVGRKNVVNIYEGGQKVQYEVQPEVYKAMLDMNKESSPLWIKVMSKPASILRAGATLTLEFAVRNPIRDVLNAFITSKSGFNPITDFAAGLGSYIKDGKLYNDFLTNNGGYGNVISMDRNLHKEALEEIIKQPASKKFTNIINPKSWLEVLRTISDATESATKVGEYRAALRSGATPQEAAYRARDLMDFARAGSSIKEANKVVAFLNANIQGKSKFIRAIKENPVKVSAKLFTTMALPSIGIYALNNKYASEEQKATIKDAPNWLRDSFWLVAIPGTNTVSNAIERFFDYTQQKDKEAFDGFITETIKEQSLPTMLTGITPIIEGMANYSFFKESPIIPQREQGLLPKDQYDIYTSEISKKIAEGIRNIPGLKNTNFASPRIVENTIRNTTAGLGGYVLDAADKALGKNKPAKNTNQQPVIKAFTVNEKSTGKALDFIYSEKDRLTKERGSFELTNKDAKFPDESKYKYMNKIAKEIGGISKEIREIQNDQKLTAVQKRDKINVLADERNRIAREAQAYYKLNKKW